MGPEVAVPCGLGPAGPGRSERNRRSDPTPGARAILAPYLHGFYVPASTPSDLPEQRILEASVHLRRAVRLPVGPPRGCGAPTSSTDLNPTVAPGFRCLWRSVPRVGPGQTSRSRSATNDYEPRRSSPCTAFPRPARERATFDAMRRTDDLRESVVDLDMMMAASRPPPNGCVRMPTPTADGPRSPRYGAQSNCPPSTAGHPTNRDSG